jgi:hypothetical protein
MGIVYLHEHKRLFIWLPFVNIKGPQTLLFVVKLFCDTFLKLLMFFQTGKYFQSPPFFRLSVFFQSPPLSGLKKFKGPPPQPISPQSSPVP